MTKRKLFNIRAVFDNIRAVFADRRAGAWRFGRADDIGKRPHLGRQFSNFFLMDLKRLANIAPLNSKTNYETIA